MDNNEKKLNERGKKKKKLDAKLELHLTGLHALSHEVSAYIYILISMMWQFFVNVFIFVNFGIVQQKELI